MDELKNDGENSKEDFFPLVSICILTYQHARYIEDCLRSVLNQSYTHTELIILDDASTDGTVDIINTFEEELKKKNSRFLFIKHNTNAGNVPGNVNEMIRLSSGKYIKLMSGDDIFLESGISSLVEFLETTDYSIAYANAYRVDDGYKYGERFLGDAILKSSHHAVPKELLFERLLMGNQIPALATMIPRWIYEKYGLYDEEIGYEDYDFWLRLAAAQEPFGYLNQFVCLYREAETGISNCNTESKFIFMYNQTMKVLKKHVGKLPLNRRTAVITQFYKTWMDNAEEKQYLTLFLQIKFGYIRWLLRNKGKEMDKRGK